MAHLIHHAAVGSTPKAVILHTVSEYATIADVIENLSFKPCHKTNQRIKYYTKSNYFQYVS
ncbi:hypothetical protein [Eubacterium sp.]